MTDADGTEKTPAADEPKRRSGMTSAVVEAAEATGQIPIGQERRAIRAKGVRDYSGPSEESKRRALGGAIESDRD